MDKLILKAAVCFFLMFIILNKALKGLSIILWLKGGIITLEKIIDLVWDKAVEYNGVSKGGGSSEAMQELSPSIYYIVNYLLLLLYILTSNKYIIVLASSSLIY